MSAASQTATRLRSRVIAVLLSFFAGGMVVAQTVAARLSGSVLDPSGRSVAGAHVEADSSSGAHLTAITGSDGGFAIELPAWGVYTVRVEAAGFATLTRKAQLSAESASLTLRLDKVSAVSEEVFVTGDLSKIGISRSFTESVGARGIARRQSWAAWRTHLDSWPPH
jgi:hypothetical protein